jgi:hypothetical protein
VIDDVVAGGLRRYRWDCMRYRGLRLQSASSSFLDRILRSSKRSGKVYRLDAQGNVEEDPSETGPLVLIRHPGWTEENPRQDIPVMVFTHAQWEALENGEFHIGAAPTNPSRLGRNSEYVFALPARYNYAFPEGYEEVEDIIESGAFEAFDR